MRKCLLPIFVAGVLSCFALYRTDFYFLKIKAPLYSNPSPAFPKELNPIISQPFSFFGKGRQSYVFASKDGTVVLKFFNRSYIEMPWYARLSPISWQKKEETKRSLRKIFYFRSYLVAEQLFKNETGLLYVHLGPSTDLPPVVLTDRASRLFSVDLNQIPFVLQKRAEPLFSALQKFSKEKREKALTGIIEDLFLLIEKRIAFGISDKDHDFEHNFAYLDGKLIQIDPGRLLEGVDFTNPEVKRHEWWAGTHRLRKWLEKEHPPLVPVFDSRLVQVYTNELKSWEFDKEAP